MSRLDLNVESTVEGENIGDAKEVIATITGERETVLAFLETALLIHKEFGDAEVIEAKVNGEEVDVSSP